MEQGQHGGCRQVGRVLVQDVLVFVQRVLEHVVACIVLGQGVIVGLFLGVHLDGLLDLGQGQILLSRAFQEGGQDEVAPGGPALRAHALDLVDGRLPAHGPRGEGGIERQRLFVVRVQAQCLFSDGKGALPVLEVEVVAELGMQRDPVICGLLLQRLDVGQGRLGARGPQCRKRADVEDVRGAHRVADQKLGLGEGLLEVPLEEVDLRHRPVQRYVLVMLPERVFHEFPRLLDIALEHVRLGCRGCDVRAQRGGLQGFAEDLEGRGGILLVEVDLGEEDSGQDIPGILLHGFGEQLLGLFRLLLFQEDLGDQRADLGRVLEFAGLAGGLQGTVEVLLRVEYGRLEEVGFGAFRVFLLHGGELVPVELVHVVPGIEHGQCHTGRHTPVRDLVGVLGPFEGGTGVLLEGIDVARHETYPRGLGEQDGTLVDECQGIGGPALGHVHLDGVDVHLLRGMWPLQQSFHETDPLVPLSAHEECLGKHLPGQDMAGIDLEDCPCLLFSHIVPFSQKQHGGEILPCLDVLRIGLGCLGKRRICLLGAVQLQLRLS
ncbi:MAG: hypothetical protein BWX71_02274 [Deltaproteobacteria bacterium ADurb.Bin072]|nr:MAG: hypothetical protein BWX71_02274 [Deltaproteobacteria bacterium ADurb.Bin072]